MCQVYSSIPNIQSSAKAHGRNSVNICGWNEFLSMEFSSVYLDAYVLISRESWKRVCVGSSGMGRLSSDCLTL